MLLLWPAAVRAQSVPEDLVTMGRNSPLFLLGTLRQGLQVELQHVPSIFVSTEVSLRIRKKQPCSNLGRFGSQWTVLSGALA